MSFPGVDIILLKQPPRSYLCGQTCVAMVTGGDTARVIKLFGHEGPTSWQQIIGALRGLHVMVMPYPASIKTQAKPNQCIVRIKSKLYPWWSHFVVFSHGYWYDPSYGSGQGMKRHPLWEPHMYQASYVELVGYSPGYRLPEPRKIKPVQPAIYADDWQKLDAVQKSSIVENVFQIGGAVDSLGSAWQVGKQMLERGFSFDWTDCGKDGFYCLMDGPEARHIGWGKTYSEAICAAALAATGFLLQRGKPRSKFLTDESKATAEKKTSARSQLH